MPARSVDIQDYRVDLDAEILGAAEELRRGGLVAVPTETVYGIAVKLDVAAGREALAALRGDATGPLTPHLPDAAAADAFLGEVSEVGRRLMRKLWPGPVALTFAVDADRRKEAAAALSCDESLLYADDGRITLRCPDEAVTREVLAEAGQPVVLTRSGLPRGVDASRPPSLDSLPGGVTTLLLAGPTRFSKPSTVVRVDGEEWSVVREGVYDRRIIEKLLRTTVLFVCSGNTCRNPMAMALARKEIADAVGVPPANLADSGYEVVSAGTFAMPGMKATPQAADAVADMGGDLAGHRSQPLTVELIHRSDLIVTMGRDHTQGVLGLVSSAARKTVTLDPDRDIEDPIGADAGHYRRLAGEIQGLVRDRLRGTILPER